MNTRFHECEQVRLAVPAVGQTIGEDRSVNLHDGLRGIIVGIHPAETTCQTYDIEFHLGGDLWAVATLPEANLLDAVTTH